MLTWCCTTDALDPGASALFSPARLRPRGCLDTALPQPGCAFSSRPPLSSFCRYVFLSSGAGSVFDADPCLPGLTSARARDQTLRCYPSSSRRTEHATARRVLVRQETRFGEEAALTHLEHLGTRVLDGTLRPSTRWNRTCRRTTRSGMSRNPFRKQPALTHLE